MAGASRGWCAGRAAPPSGWNEVRGRLGATPAGPGRRCSRSADAGRDSGYGQCEGQGFLPGMSRFGGRSMAAAAPEPGAVVDRNLALELVRVTEAAALAASRWIG